MERRTPQRKARKRPLEDEFHSASEGSRKKVVIKKETGDEIYEENFNFRILLPNGETTEVTFNETRKEIPWEEFVKLVKQEYIRGLMRQTESRKPRSINWNSDNLHFVDAFDNEIRGTLSFRAFKPFKWNLLSLKDGSGEATTFENMWDLTPDTDLLKELPAEYTFETALADLIDNSLQAIWSNKPKQRRLIRVEMENNKIVIFDSGPGMDGTDENSIAKWGKMGASLHRSSRTKAIGGKPPYLVPYFGMYGYGGPIASMNLGRLAYVSSKTRQSEKVYMLHLDRDALLSCTSSKQPWMTKGGLRDPTEEELEFGSFTRVEIVEPKIKSLDIEQLKCKLKDIYFPYIQCDEESDSGRTIRPIEFEVNGEDLAEIHGGEVATTNLNSCNGPLFTFQLRFTTNASSSSQGSNPSREANARVKCAYFPIVQGKETIDTILTTLEESGYKITENFERFSRVSIRRLGRLLPDARWPWLPLIDLRQRKGVKAQQILKRCCYRVKCFIETDAGFNPTPSKTDLAQHHPYTTVLRNLGNKLVDNDNDVQIDIYIQGKKVDIQTLDREYQDWVLKMHTTYDEEIDSGADQPTYIFNPQNKKKLGVSSDVLRMHKEFERKGTMWRSGQKIKVLKGACAGINNQHLYATLECIILEGVEGDPGGEARIICSPINVPPEKACHFGTNPENVTIEIRNSISLPISVIDSGKCNTVRDDEWNAKLQVQLQKVASSIDLLSSEQCEELQSQFGEGLPEDIIEAGYGPPKEIIAVIRPASFDSGKGSINSLDQKYIVKENYEMHISIKLETKDQGKSPLKHIFSAKVGPSSLNKLQGLYIFSLELLPHLFEKAGVYTFSLSLTEVNCRACEKKVQVKPSSEVGNWKLLSNEQIVNLCVRAGLCLPPLSVACYDRYDNRICIENDPEAVIKFKATKGVYISASNINISLNHDKSIMIIEDLRVESHDLDKIRPEYETALVISPPDESFSIDVPCQVLPGTLDHVKCIAPTFTSQLLPGHIIKELVFEMFDEFGNHIKEHETVQLNVDGFSFLDKKGYFRKVDDCGYLDLSGILKVTKGFSENANLSILCGPKVVYENEFPIEKRELRAAFEVPETCIAGSQMENMVFEVIDSQGEVDEKFHEKDEHGIFHTLTIKSDMLNIDDSVQYTFRNGRCTVRSISLPQQEGLFSFVASHSSHPQLQLTIQLQVELPVHLGVESMASQSTHEPLLLLESSSSAMETPKRKSMEFDSEGPSSLSRQDVINLLKANMEEQKELERVVSENEKFVGELEINIKMLEDKQSKEENEVLRLEASIDENGGAIIEKETILEKIESKRNSAASIVCKLLGSSSQSEKRQRDFTDDILGVVALLGTVDSIELSRVLSRYLGEEQMLAIVCKSHSSPNAYDELSTGLGYSVNGGYLVIYLEDIKAYKGQLCRDPQKTLGLLSPTLPTGKIAGGFLGYAVNLIHIDETYMHQHKTASGFGLRETLFYRLFGELQVYDTKANMNEAKSYNLIKDGAVSLDGGIIRGNGLVSLGSWEPEIQFPVVADDLSSTNSKEILKLISEMKIDIKKINKSLEEEKERLKKAKKKSNAAKEKHSKFLKDKATSVTNLSGVYTP